MTPRSGDADWSTWTRRRWNHALVDAVFSAQEGGPQTITRIDATSTFLARVAGASPSDKERARESFIRSFRSSSARDLFERSDPLSQWSPSHPDLPFFAQLYLSVMVAGADEDTHEIGQFRKRLAAMLEEPEAANLPLGHLRVLWEAAARWTQKTVRPGVRRLELPDHGHEKLIGYSKRLAFPAFKDQNTLARLVQDQGLTTQSPARHIIRAVDRSVDQFTPRFKEEFGEFKSLYFASDHARARASPFWGALHDISWAVVSKERPQRSKFVLELDLSDAFAPGLMLRSDSELSARYLPWRSTHRPFIRDGRPHEIARATGEGMLSPESLQSPSARTFLSRSRPSQCLTQGCVAFAQDDFGAWTDVGSLSEGQDFWLLVSHAKGERVRATLASVGCLPDLCGAFGSSRTWMLVGPLTFSEPLRGLLEASLGDSIFEHRLAAPRIRVTGGLQLPEGYLFLPGCAPEVSMAGAAAFRWTALTGGPMPATGALSARSMGNELMFSFSVADLRERLRGSHRLELVAFDADGDLLDQTQLRTVPECIGWSVKQPNNPGRFREIGEAGDLAGLEESSESQSLGRAAHWDLRPVTQSPLQMARPRDIEVGAMPAPWHELVEILTALFQRTATVPVQDMIGRIERVWDVGRGRAWGVLQDLIDNGLIEHRFSRHWHGSVCWACPATALIARMTDGAQVRVLGLVPAAVRRELENRARIVGGRAWLVTSPDMRTCGVLLLQVPALDDAEALCRELELPHRAQVREPEDRPLPPWAQLLACRPIEPRGERRVWSETRGAFANEVAPSPAAPSDEPQLEQWRLDGHQPRYVLRTKQFTWSTRSRMWAVLAHRAVAGAGLAEIATDGSVRLARPTLALPPRVAREVLRQGGGVCYRDEEGRRIYPAGMHWAPASLLSSWVRRGDCVERDVARERLRLALSRTARVPFAVADRYWVRTKRAR